MKLLFKKKRPVFCLYVVLLLVVCQLYAPSTVHITSDKGFLVHNVHNVNQKKQIADTALDIAILNDFFLINGASAHTDHICVMPQEGPLRVDENPYNALMLSILNHEIALDAVADPVKKDELHAGYNVRVLLDEQQPAPTLWTLSTESGFTLLNPDDPQERVQCADKQLKIGCEQTQFYCNKKKYAHKQLYIMPHAGGITVNGNTYQGGMLLTMHNGKAVLINNLDLEEYVFSVLRTESWPGWPLEVNKVLAITCRTYAIAMVRRSKTGKLPYHIKNTNAHQTYKGMHACPVIRQAVQETAGVFLAYKNEPILAMFDTCCGGVIPAKVKGFNFAKAPYLKRTYACTHCKGCRMYQWQAHYTVSGLTRALQKDLPHLTTIKSLKINKKDEAGIVHELAVHGAKRRHMISGKKVYSLLRPKVKSNMFTIFRSGDNITIKGRGIGHQLGLCQWGAREMVDKGYGYKDILNYYYPGTQYMKLS